MWSAQFLGNIGVNTLHFTLIIQVYQQTGNNFLVGVLVAVMSLPAIFLAPIAGVCADMFSRRSLLVAINLGRLIIAFLVLIAYEFPPALLVLAFLITSASQFFLPAEQSSVPDIVDKDHLVQANTFLAFSMYGAFLIGFAGAGPLVDYGGEIVTLMTVAVCFFVATIIDLTLPPLKKHIEGNTKSIRERLRVAGVWLHLKEGVEYVRRHPQLMTMILQVAFIFSVERAVISLVPELATRLFGLGVADISFFMITPLAVGTVVGVATVNVLKKKWTHMRIIRAGLIVDAIALLILPFHEEIWRAIQYAGVNMDLASYTLIHVIGIAFFSGLADVLVIVSAQTFIQRCVETERRGRVFANLQTIMNVVGVPLVLIISLMADVINIPAVLLLFGFVAVVVIVWGYIREKSQGFALK